MSMEKKRREKGREGEINERKMMLMIIAHYVL